MFENQTGMACEPQRMMGMKPLTLTQQLIDEKNRLTERLLDIDHAIEALTKNVDVQMAVDAIARLGNFR